MKKTGRRHALFLLFSVMGIMSLFSPLVQPSSADIYRFVTIDGIETFTDTPNNKNAKVIIKDRRSSPQKRRSTSPKEKVHEISLDEIAQKAVIVALNPQASHRNVFESHLPAVGGTISSGVGMRIDPFDGVWRYHNGIDIAIPGGTPVKPVAAGVTLYSGIRSGYGNTVLVEHENGVVTLYAHNSRLMVSAGQPVTEDTIIALSGSTGRSTGPHLHFEAWQAGQNVTTAFLPGSDTKLTTPALVTGGQKTARFRSQVLSDGSVLFTNIPPGTP